MVAKKTVVVLTDDLDGRNITGDEDAATVPFSLGGVEYEIDLSGEHRSEFARLLMPYVEAGRRVPRGSAQSRVVTRRLPRVQPQAQVPAQKAAPPQAPESAPEAAPQAVEPELQPVEQERVQAPARTAAGPDPEQNKQMRAWWNANWEAADLPRPNVKGRIPRLVMVSFQRHQGKRVRRRSTAAAAS